MSASRGSDTPRAATFFPVEASLPSRDEPAVRSGAAGIADPHLEDACVQYPETASAGLAASAPNLTVVTTVPGVEAGPPSNSLEQVILAVPSQAPSSPLLPPSQDLAVQFATFSSSLLATITAQLDTKLAPLSSRLSSLESSMQAKATVPEAVYSPSQPHGLWGGNPSGPVHLSRADYDEFDVDDHYVHHM